MVGELFVFWVLFGWRLLLWVGFDLGFGWFTGDFLGSYWVFAGCVLGVLLWVFLCLIKFK